MLCRAERTLLASLTAAVPSAVSVRVVAADATIVHVIAGDIAAVLLLVVVEADVGVAFVAVFVVVVAGAVAHTYFAVCFCCRCCCCCCSFV